MNWINKTNKTLLYLLIVSAVTILAGCKKEQSSNQAPPATIKGDLNVYYSLQVTETEGYSTSKPEKATAIHFYNEYIVIESKNHSGKVIPIRQIKTLIWN